MNQTSKHASRLSCERRGAMGDESKINLGLGFTILFSSLLEDQYSSQKQKLSDLPAGEPPPDKPRNSAELSTRLESMVGAARLDLMLQPVRYRSGAWTKTTPKDTTTTKSDSGRNSTSPASSDSQTKTGDPMSDISAKVLAQAMNEVMSKGVEHGDADASFLVV